MKKKLKKENNINYSLIIQISLSMKLMTMKNQIILRLFIIHGLISTLMTVVILIQNRQKIKLFFENKFLLNFAYPFFIFILFIHI